MKRILSSIALALVAALTLGACGGTDSSTNSGGSAAGDFNQADVTFAQSMIPHHEQAVKMAKMAKLHASSPAVRQLAATIEGAQGPEITAMKGWLTTWGASGSSSSMAGMDHGSPGMPGMMTDADMKSLGAMTGTAFDTRFLTMMVQHHTGAIEMARTERSKGKSPEATALAKKIETAQAAEITQMRKLLAR